MGAVTTGAATGGATTGATPGVIIVAGGGTITVSPTAGGTFGTIFVVAWTMGRADSLLVPSIARRRACRKISSRFVLAAVGAGAGTCAHKFEPIRTKANKVVFTINW